MIELFRATEDPHTPGTSMWDHAVIAMPTDFGRDKTLDANEGTGHHLNNAMLFVAPGVRGDRALGQADPRNGWICGFDVDTGAATPFGRLDAEGAPLNPATLPPGDATMFGVTLDLLGIGYDGQLTVPAMRR